MQGLFWDAEQICGGCCADDITGRLAVLDVLPHPPPSCNSILAIPLSCLMDYQTLGTQMLTAPISYEQKQLQIEISFPLPERLTTHLLLAIAIRWD